MSDLLIKRALPQAAALVEAVAAGDQDGVAEVLLGRTNAELYALAIVLAGQQLPPEAETEQMSKAVYLTAAAFGTTTSVVLSESRRREALDARATAAYVGHLLGLTYSRIGAELGRDHSTVIHSCGRVGETPRLRGLAQRIAEQLGWDRELVSA